MKNGGLFFGADIAIRKTLIRHDSDKLARLILGILRREEELKYNES